MNDILDNNAPVGGMSEELTKNKPVFFRGAAWLLQAALNAGTGYSITGVQILSDGWRPEMRQDLYGECLDVHVRLYPAELGNLSGDVLLEFVTFANLLGKKPEEDGPGRGAGAKDGDVVHPHTVVGAQKRVDFVEGCLTHGNDFCVCHDSKHKTARRKRGQRSNSGSISGGFGAGGGRVGLEGRAA